MQPHKFNLVGDTFTHLTNGNKGYSVQEIRNILTTDDESLPGSDSQDMKDMIEFHKIRNTGTRKKLSNTLNFATHKSDPAVAAFINTLSQYEE